jgi:hypothetical protein
MNNSENVIADMIVEQLKTMDVDGETMQYILNKVGMEDQMHRQLVMTMPTEKTLELLDEKKDLEDARFMCDNCGGGFKRKEMVFGDDNDLCEDCSK